MNKFSVFIALFSILFSSCSHVEESSSDLQFEHLPTAWDEAIPLGNATMGELVWQKDSTLRLSLDHTGLWDLRPTDEFEDTARFRYRWIKEQIETGNQAAIVGLGDTHYDQEPGPAKIPCAALTFPIESLGEVSSVRLRLHDALCRVEWKNGASLETFVQADH